jgi:hypothetical protein
MFRCSLFAATVIGLASLPATAQQGQRDFPQIVPGDWTVMSPGRSNEWRAVSPRKDAWLTLYATAAKDSPSAHLVRWGVKSGDRVSYARHGEQWSVVSGYTPNRRIFYRETMLACGGRQWHNLEFEYPAKDKQRMDRFVDRASHALGAYKTAGC